MTQLWGELSMVDTTYLSLCSISSWKQKNTKKEKNKIHRVLHIYAGHHNQECSKMGCQFGSTLVSGRVKMRLIHIGDNTLSKSTCVKTHIHTHILKRMKEEIKKGHIFH